MKKDFILIGDKVLIEPESEKAKQTEVFIYLKESKKKKKFSTVE